MDNELLTMPQIMAATGATYAQVRYALERHRIDPVGRFGRIRVWSRDQLEQIRSTLARTTGRPVSEFMATETVRA